MYQIIIKRSEVCLILNWLELALAMPTMMDGKTLHIEEKLEFHLRNIIWNWNKIQPQRKLNLLMRRSISRCSSSSTTGPRLSKAH